MNPREKDMAVLSCIVITIDDDNYTEPDNFPEQQ